MKNLQGCSQYSPTRRARGRRRAELPARYLLDARLFRLLRDRPAALEAFRASLPPHGIAAAADGLPALEMTPLALLEALGVEPPQFDFFTLPPSVVVSGESLQATTLVVKVFESSLRKSPDLQPDSLRARAEKLRPAAEGPARELFDLLVTRVVAEDGFENPIVKQLAFDYLFRFPFPDLLREEVFEFLCASLFGTDETVSGLSKMRAVKTLWDRAYPRLLKGNPGMRGELQLLDREVKPRSRMDQLAWELVHYAVLGSAVESRFQPVTAFTLDSAERVRSRGIAYKSALRSFLDQIGPEDRETLRSNLQAWRPGELVPCQPDGACESPIPTGGLPVLAGEPRNLLGGGQLGGGQLGGGQLGGGQRPAQGEDRGDDRGGVEVEVRDVDAEDRHPREGGLEEGEGDDGDPDGVIADLEPERPLPGAEEEP